METGAGERVVGIVDGAGWSERVAVPTARMAVLPDGVSFGAAATLPIAGLTALRTLRFGGNLLGRRVLVTGASGGGSCRGRVRIQAGRGDCGNSAHPRSSQMRGRPKVLSTSLASVGGDSLAAALEKIAPDGTIVAFGNSSGEATLVSFYDFAGGLGSRM